MHEEYTNENTTTCESGRVVQGRFAKGNRGGPGNPHARRCAHLKQLLQAATSDEEVLEVLAVLKRLALGGDVQAIKLFLAYQIGTPAEMPDPDTLDQQELGDLECGGLTPLFFFCDEKLPVFSALNAIIA